MGQSGTRGQESFLVGSLAIHTNVHIQNVQRVRNTGMLNELVLHVGGCGLALMGVVNLQQS